MASKGKPVSDNDLDYPRIRFQTPGRTFDRLLKERSLSDLKETVRKKLGLGSASVIQFTQRHNGQLVDLEDEDDFDAFRAVANEQRHANVQVVLIENSVIEETFDAKSSTSPLPPTLASQLNDSSPRSQPGPNASPSRVPPAMSSPRLGAHPSAMPPSPPPMAAQMQPPVPWPSYYYGPYISGVPMSSRTHSLTLQSPGTPTLSHAAPSPISHSPPLISHAPSGSMSSMSSPPPTPSSALPGTGRLSVHSSAFVPGGHKKVVLKNEDGIEVNLETLTNKVSPTPPTPSVTARQNLPAMPTRKPVPIRIETPEQRQKRLEEEEKEAKASAEERAKREEEEERRKEEEERKKNEEEDRKRQEEEEEEEEEEERLKEEEEKEQLRKQEEEKEQLRREEEEKERLRKEDEAKELRRKEEEQKEKERLLREEEGKGRREQEVHIRLAEEKEREEEERRKAEEEPSSALPDTGRLSVHSSVFVPGGHKKVVLKNEDGIEVNLETLTTKVSPTPPTPSVTARQNLPATLTRKTAPIRIETPEQRQKRLEGEEQEEKEGSVGNERHGSQYSHRGSMLAACTWSVMKDDCFLGL